MNEPFGRLSAIIMTMALLLPWPAIADTKRQAASLLFERANELRRAKKYEAALKRYMTARELLPSFKIDYNIALTLASMGRNVEAARAYEIFLESGKSKSPKKMLELAKKNLRSLLIKKIAVVKIECETAGSTMKVDGKDAGKTPLISSIYLAPGKHRVELIKKGHEPFTKEVNLRKGKTTTIRAKMKITKPQKNESLELPSWASTPVVKQRKKKPKVRKPKKAESLKLPSWATQ